MLTKVQEDEEINNLNLNSKQFLYILFVFKLFNKSLTLEF